MKKIIKRVLIGLLILCAAFIAFILNETKDEINATPSTIEATLKKFHNKTAMAGFAVAVFNKDSIFYANGFGLADIENQVSYTKKTQQYIASISKTTIAIALLKAEELGLLTINDPINQHLPFKVVNPHFPNTVITILQLATHTSSLDYNEKVVESLYIGNAEKEASLQSFMDRYFINGDYGKVLFTKNKPGEHWNYSNIGAGLAAFIIEYKSGVSFAEFTQKYVFEPLKMSNTHWFESKKDSSLYAKYYGENLKKIPSKGVILYPARDMITNITDLTTFCQAMMKRDESILSKKSYEFMFNPTPYTIDNPVFDKMALFWAKDRNQHGITYQMTGANGGDDGINTMMWFDPVTDLGYIFIGNTGASDKNWASDIRIYRTLVSLGDHFLMTDPNTNFIEKMNYKWHNLFSRVNGLF